MQSFANPAMLQDALQKAIDGMDPETHRRSILRVEWDRGDLAPSLHNSESTCQNSLCVMQHSWSLEDSAEALIDNMGLAHLPAPGTQSLPLISGPGALL